MPNQYKPIPPASLIAEGIEKYFNQGLTDRQIIGALKAANYFDADVYGLGLKTFRKIREGLGYVRSRKAAFTVEEIRPVMVELRKTYPRAGLRDMKAILWSEQRMSVTRTVLTRYFNQYEPELVRQRRSERFRRKRFWAAGVGDMLCCDQHDKWKRFGLKLHTGIDPFVGKTHWIKIWYTNSNPILIASYYLDNSKETGFIPLITQSDPGSENFGIAKAQTFLRHWHDPAMEGYLAHRWMKEKKNIPPEISWSQMRRRFTPGFENILDYGVNMGWYDIGDTVQKLVFRWVFIPWLQLELDGYKNRINNSKKRRDRNKILPHGVPEHMAEFPALYGCLDFRIKVQLDAIEAARQLYAPPNHPVFKLVPDSFDVVVQHEYQAIGSPPVTRGTAWNIYLQLVARVYTHLGEEQEELQDDWACEIELSESDDAVEIDFNGLQQLVDTGDQDDGSFYQGGVNRGAGIDAGHNNLLDDMLNDDEPPVDGQLWIEGSPPPCVMFSEDEEDNDEDEEDSL